MLKFTKDCDFSLCMTDYFTMYNALRNYFIETGASPYSFARDAGLGINTLRYIKDKRPKHEMKVSTLKKAYDYLISLNTSKKHKKQDKGGNA